MTGSMSAAQQRQQSNRTHDGRYAEGSHSEPDVDLGTRPAERSPMSHHYASAQAYRDHIEDLHRQLTDAKAQQARHELAEFATNQPDARYLNVVGGYGDDGEPVLHAGEAYDHDGALTATSDDHGDLSGWEAPSRGTFEDFRDDSSANVVDLDKVRTWSTGSTPATPHGLAWQQSIRAQRVAEPATLQGMAGDVRRRHPGARFVHVTDNDLGNMTYESVTDQNGEVLHENVGDDSDAAFTETMQRWSDDLDERGLHWTGVAADTANGVAVDRDRHFGQVRSATLDLDKVDALS